LRLIAVRRVAALLEQLPFSTGPLALAAIDSSCFLVPYSSSLPDEQDRCFNRWQ